MQLKWIWPIAVLMLSFLSPNKLGGVKFIPIYEALVIRAQKSSPPHIAFEEVNNFSKNTANKNWSYMDSVPATQLVAGGGISKSLAPAKIKTQRLVLNELVITKKPELVQALVQHEEWKKEFNQTLNSKQQQIIAQAQIKSEVLDQDWSVPDWSTEVEKKLVEAGYMKPGSQIVESTETIKKPKVYVAGTDALGQTRDRIPQGSTEVVRGQASGSESRTDNSPANGFLGTTKNISGPIEITGGLAVTNDHYIEVRRTNEGVAREIGRVDLQKGTYNIAVQEPSGSIEAKLVDRAGKILGEGSIRIARLDTNRGDILGPKLKILPHESVMGFASDFYKNKTDNSAPPKTIATLLKGVEEMNVTKDGRISMEKMAKGSSTVLRVAAPRYMQTASLVTSGEEFNAPMFPTSMIQALKEIVNSEKIVALTDTSIQEQLGTVVWGKVSQDTKAISGIKVHLEGNEELLPIYFNQFMLPDPKLAETTENGLYVFIDVSEGFQSLVAMRGESIFGYQNVVVEVGSVALADIENSIKIESVPMRIFDAFTGTALAANVTLQSIEHEIEVTDGSSVLLLPQVNRVGLIRAVVHGNDYLPARFIYNDKDSFIHLPMVQWSWLTNIKTFLKINDTADTGIVVGFVPDENFEVYIAGYDKFETQNIVYFDMQGKILQNTTGIAGGGFILYNVPADTHELVVVGAKTQKIYSKVLPVDVNTLSVLSFRE